MPPASKMEVPRHIFSGGRIKEIAILKHQALKDQNSGN
jgi:hypothetical protein